MLADELARGDGNHRHDLVLQVFAAPGLELGQRMRRQGRDVELSKFQHADLAAPVAVDDAAVLAFGGLTIEHGAFDQKNDPNLVADSVEQRMVANEKG